MKGTNELPGGYTPFDELIVCSNKLIKGTRPFEIEGKTPLLVGKDKGPLIWLYLPTSKGTPEWSQLVTANKSLNSNIKVNITDEIRVNVTAGFHAIIDVILQSPETAEILQLDLRPFGLDIHGDTQSLYIAKSRFSHNTFQNVNVMIGIGNKPQPPGASKGP